MHKRVNSDFVKPTLKKSNSRKLLKNDGFCTLSQSSIEEPEILEGNPMS